MADHCSKAVSEALSRTRIVFVTTCRSDYGPAYWLLHDLFKDERIELLLVVAGSHLSARHGLTMSEIEADGWPIAERIPFLRAGDDGPAAYGAAMGVAMTGFSAALERLRPSAVVVLGDRLELLAVAAAAVISRTPLVHLCGGDVTEGSLDEQVRHAVTKMAHLHFPATDTSAARILQMGEEAWRVHVVGDPALDHFRRGVRAGISEVEALVGFRPTHDTLLVTQHAVTVAQDESQAEVEELAAALMEYSGSLIVTAPSPDPGSAVVRDILTGVVAARPNAVFIESLGSRRYRAVLELVGAMVGNSSSGLIEAATVGLPVVNIGQRQEGRERGVNVIDTIAERASIAAAVRRALGADFRASIAGAPNPYGDGNASAQIVEVLASLPDAARLLKKRFVPIPHDQTASILSATR
jgi:UDP-hydrolysing UDP-N-acetyl-D-glucosamine 2-epimerase